MSYLLKLIDTVGIYAIKNSLSTAVGNIPNKTAEIYDEIITATVYKSAVLETDRGKSSDVWYARRKPFEEEKETLLKLKVFVQFFWVL